MTPPLAKQWPLNHQQRQFVSAFAVSVRLYSEIIAERMSKMYSKGCQIFFTH